MRYGGEVARYFGDGVMAFFGWPRAHEDDAVRAIHAALEIVSGVTKISGPVTLTCRVGVCSGPVVVGEIGDSGTWSMDAVGETPNIDARLETLAVDNTVLLSGIPGVGKSRLLHELKSHIQQEPHVLLHHQCSPYHSQSAFFPVIGQIEQAAQLTAREANADKIAKLKAYLPRSTDSSIEPVLLIAKLLSIPLENHHELSGLTPQQIKNRTISTLVDMILAFSVQRP